MIKLKGRKFARKLWLFAAVLWMAVIFIFSSQNGEASTRQSTIVTTIVTEVIGVEPTHQDFLTIEFTVRKIAHFCIFSVLGAIFCGYFGCFKIGVKARVAFSLLATLAYAAVDELHQYFVPDRSARLYDVFIDTAGGMCGIIAALLIFFIISKLKSRKHNINA